MTPRRRVIRRVPARPQVAFGVAEKGVERGRLPNQAIKSRVHFRRGFDDAGFVKTILLVEPEQSFLGTVRLEALPYRNVDISKFYPYGDVSFP